MAAEPERISQLGRESIALPGEGRDGERLAQEAGRPLLAKPAQRDAEKGTYCNLRGRWRRFGQRALEQTGSHLWRPDRQGAPSPGKQGFGHEFVACGLDGEGVGGSRATTHEEAHGAPVRDGPRAGRDARIHGGPEERMREAQRAPGREHAGSGQSVGRALGCVAVEPGQVCGSSRPRAVAEHRCSPRQRDSLYSKPAQKVGLHQNAMLALVRLRNAGETLEPGTKERGRSPSRGRLAPATVHAMHSSRHDAPARVWIELDVEARSIAGVLHRDDRPVRPFDGWLELVALLEDLRQPDASDGSPSEPTTDRP